MPPKTATTLTFGDGCAEALDAVRADGGPGGWAALTYAEGSLDTLTPFASGTGNADELAAKLEDKKVIYALVRTKERIDKTEAVRFCYIIYVGSGIDSKLRQRIGVVSGSVKDFFAPAHITINADTPAEVSQAIVEDLMATTSGQKTHVREGAGGPTSTPNMGAAPKKGALSTVGGLARGTTAEDRAAKAGNKGIPVPKSTSNLAIDNPTAIKEAIDDVRADGTPTNWAALTYVPGAKPEQIKLAGSGDGGVAQMLELLRDGQTYYCLTRHTEAYDKSTTVKFAAVTLIGSATPTMLKAKIGTHKGAIQEIMGPTHVNYQTDDIADISEASLTKMIGKASGTNSNVL